MERTSRHSSVLLVAATLVAALAADAIPEQGARVHLVPPMDMTGTGAQAAGERGIFFGTLRGFEVSAVQVRLDLASATTITARIYNATGETRGSLLAQGSAALTDLGNVDHTIPVFTQLDPCTDYNVSIEFDNADGWDYADEALLGPAYERHGVAMVRGGEEGGVSGGTTEMLHIALLGEAEPATRLDLTPTGFQFLGDCNDPSTDRSIFVTARRTMAVTAMAFDYDPPGTGIDLTLKIFEADGVVRGALLAEGVITVPLNERDMWWAPITAVLHEGYDYELVAQFTPGGWGCMYETGIPLPYVKGGVIEVRDGAGSGQASNSIIPHFAVEYSTDVGGVGVDLGKEPGIPPLTSTDTSVDRSLFGHSLQEQDVFSLGWYADVPDGTEITARVYHAPGGSRGALLSEGSIVSTGGGERWHDVPVAVHLSAGENYEFAVDFPAVNAWRHWSGGIGGTLTPSPALEVYEAWANGTVSTLVPHLRLTACYEPAVTAVGGRPIAASGVALREPFPNPTGGETFVEYEVVQGGPATLELFDVRGRLVRSIAARLPAGEGRVRFDAAGIATGMYFVKLTGPRASVSRKVLIVR